MESSAAGLHEFPGNGCDKTRDANYILKQQKHCVWILLRCVFLMGLKLLFAIDQILFWFYASPPPVGWYSNKVL